MDRYDAIRRPRHPQAFIEVVQKRLREALTRFDTALEPGTTGGVDIVRKHGEPWIKVSPPGRQEVALHLLQSALVHVNTLLRQDILSEEK
ncbi:hypothetical protein [Streptomyces spinosirectus]